MLTSDPASETIDQDLSSLMIGHPNGQFADISNNSRSGTGKDHIPPGIDAARGRMNVEQRLLTELDTGFDSHALELLAAQHTPTFTQFPTPIEPPSFSVHRLPPELLGKIFLHCLPDPPDSDRILSSGVRARDAPLLLCQICGYWRTTALTLPALWSSLSIFVSQMGHRPHLSLVKLWLQRSSTYPLTLSLDCPYGTSTLITGDDALNVLIPHFHHMREFRLALTLHSYKSLLSIPENGAPILEHLFLALSFWGNKQTDRLSLLFQSPRLRHIGWRNHTTTNVLALNMPLSQLTSIELDCPLAVMECIHILYNCTSVERCTLIDVHSPYNPPWSLSLPFRFELQHLHSFTIHTNLDLAPLWDTITLPAARALTIEYDDATYHPPWPQANFAAMLLRSACPLETLVLNRAKIVEDDLIECLRLTTSTLIELDIDDWRCISITDKLLRMLTFSGPQGSGNGEEKLPCLCPRLQIFKIGGCISSAYDGTFSQMVASRWRFSDEHGERTGAHPGTDWVSRPTLIELEFNPDLGEDHGLDLTRLKEMRNEGLTMYLHTWFCVDRV